jgi:hypothetical protein
MFPFSVYASSPMHSSSDFDGKVHGFLGSGRVTAKPEVAPFWVREGLATNQEFANSTTVECPTSTSVHAKVYWRSMESCSRPLKLVLSHPWRDEAALRIGHLLIAEDRVGADRRLL